MVSCAGFSCLRGIRSTCLPLTTFVAFSLLLAWIFVLYQPNYGPGKKQKIAWQSWESVSIKAPARPSVSKPSDANHGAGGAAAKGGVDWWNVTRPDEKIDYASLPLDVWSPLLPHDTGCEYFVADV